jgi:hypothetical protein
MEPLRFYGEDEAIDPQHRVTPDDLTGYIRLILWTTGFGWLGGIEMHQVGNFEEPRVFPPPEAFQAPSMCTGPKAW